MADRLKEKGYPAAVVGQVIAELKKAGQIDDGKFARFWIESRLHLNPKGEVVLRHELKGKGVSDAVIAGAMASLGDAYDEYAVARSMAAERMRQLERIDRRKAMKRVYDFLVRRGFKYDVIERIIGELGATP
jgi:regulatory protein